MRFLRYGIVSLGIGFFIFLTSHGTNFNLSGHWFQILRSSLILLVVRVRTFILTTMQLCLAHRGLWSDKLHLSGTFKSDSYTYSATYSFKNHLQTDEMEWRYSCIDLMAVSCSRYTTSHFAGILSPFRLSANGMVSTTCMT